MTEWHFHDRFDEWTLVLAGRREPKADEAEPRVPVPPMYVVARLRDLLAGPNREPLLRAYEAVSGARAPVGAAPDPEALRSVRGRLEAAFARGELLALRAPRRRTVVPLEDDLLAPSFDEGTEKKTWFSIKVLDEVGDPIDGLDVRFTVDGATRVVTTNGAGVARVPDAEGGIASAVVASEAALEAKVKPRWKEPRTPNIVPGPAVDAQELSDLREVTLQAEVPFTLTIVPHFRCTEIPGAHFEFGHSFVRSEAFSTLSELAEDLYKDETRGAMIFGHTDKAGPEAMNKELSERRAKAVSALFTHDTKAWLELWRGTADGKHWREQWGTIELQHMLNALRVQDDKGRPLKENGALDVPTKQALSRFQRGEYEDRPVELGPIPDTKGKMDYKKDDTTLTQLFKAYAMRVTREPIDAARFGDVGGSKFMGCGEFNPLSEHAKDDASRRVIVFTYDKAAEPQGLPCALRDLAPCNGNLIPPPKGPPPKPDPAAPPEKKLPYRCKVYTSIASKCPCLGGVELAHDVLIRVPFTLEEVGKMPDVFHLQSEDGTIEQKKSLAKDTRAGDDGVAELYFQDLPPRHKYKLVSKGAGADYEIFGETPFLELRQLSQDTIYDPSEGVPPVTTDPLGAELAAKGGGTP